MSIDLRMLTTGGALASTLVQQLFAHASTLCPELPPGTRLGNYSIGCLIAQGGGGAVYRAERVDGAFSQNVAIKLVRADHAQRGPTCLERNILAQLSDSRIARIYDGGDYEDMSWFAMELVAGEHIDVHCARNALPWEQRVRLISEVCDAVLHAHCHGIVHGDIKPSNVLVDAQGKIKLVDFGVAVKEGIRSVVPHGRSLTLAYASPEQIEGEPITVASDIFQLGLLLAAVLADCEAPEAPLSLRPSRACTLVRRNVDAIVERCTQPSPVNRYRDAAELREDLERAGRLMPVRARRWSSYFRLRLLFARRRLAALASTVVVLFTVVISAYHVAVVTGVEGRVRAEANQARVAIDFASELLRSGIIGRDERESVRPLVILDRAAVRTRLGTTPPRQRAIAVEAIAEAYLSLGAADRARQLLDSTLLTLAELGAEATEDRARLTIALARVSRETGALEESARLLKQAEQAIAEGAVEVSPDTRLLLAVSRAENLEREGKYAEARELIDTMDAFASRNGLEATATYATLLLMRAQFQRFDGELRSARASALKARDIYMKSRGAGSEGAIRSIGLLVHLGDQENDHSNFEEMLESQIALSARTYGKNSSEYARLLVIRANSYASKIHELDPAQIDRALALYAEAVDILAFTQVPASRKLAYARHNYADMLLDTGRPGPAADQFELALRARLMVIDPQHLEVVENRAALARAQCLADRDGAHAAEVLAQVRKDVFHRVPKHVFNVYLAVWTVECLLHTEREEEARRLAKWLTPSRIQQLTDWPRVHAERIVAAARKKTIASRPAPPLHPNG